jgi:hypothetical protein
MVVKLIFTDNSETVRSFSNKELSDLKLFDKLKEYFTKKLNPEFPIESFEIFDRKKCAVEDDYNIRNFSLVDYFNSSQSFIGVVIDEKVVKRVEFFGVDSYEYGLDSLEGEPYDRTVKFDYRFDGYDRYLLFMASKLKSQLKAEAKVLDKICFLKYLHKIKNILGR